MAGFEEQHEAVDGPALGERVGEGEVGPGVARIEGSGAVEAEGLEGEADDRRAGADLRQTGESRARGSRSSTAAQREWGSGG